MIQVFDAASKADLAALGPIAAALPNPGLEELLEAAERFCDPSSPGGFAETLREQKQTAIAVRGRISGTPAGVIRR